MSGRTTATSTRITTSDRSSGHRRGAEFVSRAPASFRRFRSLLALLASLAAAGCAATSAPIAMPPDAAAIHAAERARGAFESRRPLVRDPELAAGISEIGLEAIGESPLLAARDGEEAALKEGWRFLVLDDRSRRPFSSLTGRSSFPGGRSPLCRASRRSSSCSGPLRRRSRAALSGPWRRAV